MLGREITIRTVDGGLKGRLSFIEMSKDIPYEIKRMYYIYKAPEGTLRGGHAHKELKQILFCPYGQIEITLDDGNTRESILLNDPSKGLIVDSLVWREMLWVEDDSVLMVGASLPYDEDDYIRDYNEFLHLVNNV